MTCVKMEKSDGEKAQRQRISLSRGWKLVREHPSIFLVCIAKSKKACKLRLLVIEFNRKVSVFRFQLFKFLDPDT